MSSPDRTCRDCQHRTRHNTCAEPVEAGLEKEWEITWPPAGYAEQCPAFKATLSYLRRLEEQGA